MQGLGFRDEHYIHIYNVYIYIYNIHIYIYISCAFWALRCRVFKASRTKLDRGRRGDGVRKGAQ